MKETKLKICTWPEKILRKKCREVKTFDGRIKCLFSEMLSLMRITDGVGLAANQVGLDLRLVVVELNSKVFKLVNPRITKKKGSLRFLEGCLSFPGLELEIKRSEKVWLSAQDEEGKEINLEAKGPLAVIFQHELDHIDGIVFIDRASFWQKLRAKPKLKAIVRRAKDEVRKPKEK